MKIVFMGTPEIAVPILKDIVEEGHEVLLVVCQPDKPKGRGNKLQKPPVKEYAEEHNLKIFQPEKLRNNQSAVDEIASYAPDFIVVAAYGKILPQSVLDIPKFAPINVHYSLLPKYRGAAPVNWAIINGEEKSGVTTMLMDAGLDTGDILLKEEVLIGQFDNSETLSNKLAEVGGRLLIKTLADFADIVPIKQNEEETCYSPMIKKDDGKINFEKDAAVIEREIRGFYPWPSTFALYNGKVVKILKSEVCFGDYSGRAGEVVYCSKHEFIIKCGKAYLKPLELQMEGKAKVDVKSFLSGYKIKVGDIFE